jgi:hypothetical protein
MKGWRNMAISWRTIQPGQEEDAGAEVEQGGAPAPQEDGDPAGEREGAEA